jgi:hypothetical protein
MVHVVRWVQKFETWLRLSVLTVPLLASSCSHVALDERFHNPDLGNWTVVDEAETVEGPSVWRVEQDGRVHQRSNIWGRRGDFLGRWYGTLLVTGNDTWRDYTLSLRALASDNDGFGIVFRYTDPQHFYRLLFIESEMNGGPLARLDKRMGDDYTGLWSSPRGYKAGREMIISISVSGKTISASIDGTALVNIVDDTYPRGRVGLFCFAQNGQAFDDVRVTLK